MDTNGDDPRLTRTRPASGFRVNSRPFVVAHPSSGESGSRRRSRHPDGDALVRERRRRGTAASPGASLASASPPSTIDHLPLNMPHRPCPAFTPRSWLRAPCFPACRTGKAGGKRRTGRGSQTRTQCLSERDVPPMERPQQVRRRQVRAPLRQAQGLEQAERVETAVVQGPCPVGRVPSPVPSACQGDGAQLARDVEVWAADRRRSGALDCEQRRRHEPGGRC